MISYKDKPWLTEYANLPQTISSQFENALQMFEGACERCPDRALIHYFHSTLTLRQVDEMSNSLAAYFIELGLQRGDRIAVYLQNMPQFVLTLLATWKVGAVMVSVNPMYQRNEVTHILNDSGAKLLVTIESLYQKVVKELLNDTAVQQVITTSELDFLEEAIPDLLRGIERQPTSDALDFLDIIKTYKNKQGQGISLKGEDLALLTYTSGTTGPAKGAMVSHENIVFNSELLQQWIDLGDDSTILAIAPLFHATGLIVCVTTSFIGPSALILFYRFDTLTAAELIEYHQANYTAGAITAFSAFMNTPEVQKFDLSSLSKLHSGGAPISSAIVKDYENKFGVRIYPAYGMTETTATAVLAPFGSDTPIDSETGTLSVGLPVSTCASLMSRVIQCQ
ncbi:MAG: AMP-binding protein [Gammaproteobacteria bacterium]|nr:AMP-binding protein [Gammaproteobacteria bacterium]